MFKNSPKSSNEKQIKIIAYENVIRHVKAENNFYHLLFLRGSQENGDKRVKSLSLLAKSPR